MNPLKRFFDQTKKSARKLAGAVARLVKDGLSGSEVVERLKSRLDLWQNVGREVQHKGMIDEPNSEKKLVWRLGGTEDHCTDCSALNGKVLTASEWKSAGIAPQSRDLECGGWRCDCRLEETGEPSVGLSAI
jgi:hypothetical protein